jgi:hypothetical protein
MLLSYLYCTQENLLPSGILLGTTGLRMLCVNMQAAFRLESDEDKSSGSEWTWWSIDLHTNHDLIGKKHCCSCRSLLC